MKAGDLPALRRCTIECNSLSAGVIEPEERHGLREEAARSLIEAVGAAPQQQDIVPLAVAYDLTSTRAGAGGQSTVDEAAVQKAYDLIRRPDFEALATQSPSTPYGGFDLVVASIYGSHLYLKIRGLSPAAADASFQQCAATALATYTAPLKPSADGICSTAYRLKYGASPPDALSTAWFRANLAQIRARIDRERQERDRVRS